MLIWIQQVTCCMRAWCVKVWLWEPTWSLLFHTAHVHFLLLHWQRFIERLCHAIGNLWCHDRVSIRVSDYLMLLTDCLAIFNRSSALALQSHVLVFPSRFLCSIYFCLFTYDRINNNKSCRICLAWLDLINWVLLFTAIFGLLFAFEPHICLKYQAIGHHPEKLVILSSVSIGALHRMDIWSLVWLLELWLQLLLLQHLSFVTIVVPT